MTEPTQPKQESIIAVLQQELQQSNNNRLYILALLQDAQNTISELQAEISQSKSAETSDVVGTRKK